MIVTYKETSTDFAIVCLTTFTRVRQIDRTRKNISYNMEKESHKNITSEERCIIYRNPGPLIYFSVVVITMHFNNHS